jgi:hypothetical protein
MDEEEPVRLARMPAGTAYGKEAVYTLDGRRLQGQPSAKGVYIINGKKVIKSK